MLSSFSMITLELGKEEIKSMRFDYDRQQKLGKQYVPQLVVSISKAAKKKDEAALKKMIGDAAKRDTLEEPGFWQVFREGYGETIQSLAKENDIETLEFLHQHFVITENDDCQAVIGFAKGGHIEQVNKQLAKIVGCIHAELFYGNAVAGYAHAGYLRADHLLRLITLTDNKRVRVLIVKRTKIENKNLDEKALLKHSEKLRELIDKYNMTFDQAVGYMNAQRAKANIWLYQGLQLVREKRLTLDDYLHILSFITGYSGNEYNRKIVVVANQRLRDHTISATTSKFTDILPFFKSKKGTKHIKKEAEAEAEAEARCSKRLSSV